MGTVCTQWRSVLPTLPWGQQPLFPAHPALPAERVPPEDDEYSEYSEYSVEEYQDPEAPWDSDGENGGLRPKGLGEGQAELTLADLPLTF